MIYEEKEGRMGEVLRRPVPFGGKNPVLTVLLWLE